MSIIALKHDDVRDHNKPGARCIAGDLRGPAVEADGKQAVRNALAVVYSLTNIMHITNCCVPLCHATSKRHDQLTWHVLPIDPKLKKQRAVAIRNDTLQVN